MTTKLTKDNIENLKNFSVSWQSVITADGSTTTNLESGKGYFINTTSASHTVVLPTNANIGDIISIKDYAGTFGTNTLIINRNGHNIQGVANNGQVKTNRASVSLFYVDSTKGWIYSKESNVADLQDIRYVTATGGTIATSGDYKIHSFTGDGCFVVSCGGNPAGSGSVDYLVVAGGGAGQGGAPGSDIGTGGGGAGGYRTSFPGGTKITTTTTTYPVTVGAGGAGTPNSSTTATNGSPSIFSTITSTGGGRSAVNATPGSPAWSGFPGGSGGGRSGPCGTAGGGNTPPVSPPQGNPGGIGATDGVTGGGGGGGGGASSAGTPTPPGTYQGGPGGAGSANSITGSSVTYAGGGGGAAGRNNGTTQGTGGAGGGGNAPGGSGTTNRGSGGSGAPGYVSGPLVSGSGGSGIVIIRYKYQN
tara:strand:+ start:172 stop:1425 length:1254 start_codon:yes stop_codon:yes gene_type:complete